jgi:hypothetical protein
VVKCDMPVEVVFEKLRRDDFIFQPKQPGYGVLHVR